ncbi:MAG: hypothetical protein BWY75_02313 [bacterium ADurb.Bin425]|nr:MAG: hypothetical protein BWY75_02313 [bacterium ADurb.Bin425]
MPIDRSSKFKDKLLRAMVLAEETLFDVEQEHARADYHQSELVSTSCENARTALTQAVRFYALDKPQRAEKHCCKAWFYLIFARKILEAEFTEHQLGENAFLDLIPTKQSIKREIKALMNELKQELNCIYDSLDPLQEPRQ